MNRPIYIYDSRTQYQEPICVMYDEKNVEPVLMALFGCYPDFVHVSNVRLHKYDGNNESYGGRSSAKNPTAYKRRW